MAGASDVEVDSQGRILIPDYLRKYAGLKKEVVVAGLYNRIEIWETASWREFFSKSSGDFEKTAEHMLDVD